MTDDIAAAEAREVLEGRATDNKLTAPLAPLLDGRQLERYLFIVDNWDRLRRRAPGLPGDPHDSRYIEQHLAPKHAGRAYSLALREGSQGVLNYLNGLTNKEPPMSVVRRLVELQKRTRQSGYTATFAGETNEGKTNLAWLMAELAMMDDPDMQLITNSTTLANHPEDRTHVVENYHKMKYLVTEFSGPWFIVLDEMSSHVSGYSDDRADVEEHMRPFTRYAAKRDLRLLTLGHQGDIHPIIRKSSDDFIVMQRERDSVHDNPEADEFTAEFYADVSDDGREGEDLRFRLPDIPPTGWDYNPNEETRWSFEKPAE